MTRKRIYEVAVVFFLAMACGAAVGDQGDVSVLSFSAAMLASLFWWGER